MSTGRASAAGRYNGRVLEIAIVLVGVLAFGLAGVLTPGLLATAGLGILALGLAIGVPTGVWYHVVLYRIVSARASVARRWWLSPARLHPHLTAADWRRITPWYRAGGVGFALCLAGGLLAIAAALLWRS